MPGGVRRCKVAITSPHGTPEPIEGDVIDLGGYLVEHLSLELDPFPRKPGAVFEQPPEPGEISPFAVLKGLRPTDGSGEG